MAKEKKEKPVYPKKIQRGYNLITAASIIMIITSVVFFGLATISIFVILDPTRSTIDATLPELIFFTVLLFSIGLFDVLASIAGLSYANHKTALVQATGVFAFISLVVFIAETASGVISMIRNPGNIVLELVGLVIANVGTALSFLGWFISKDYFED